MADSDTAHLTADVEPADATDKSVTWSSSDPSTVSVDSDGNITGLKEGTATITVTCNGDTSVTDSATITVVKAAVTPPTPTVVKPTGVTVAGLPDTLDLHTSSTRTFDLTASVTPDDASDKSVAWSVTGPATLSGSTLTVTGTGTITVTATCNGDSSVTGTASLTVTDSTPVVVKPTNVTVTGLPSSFDVYGWQPVTLTASVTPDDATDKSVTWSSSDDSVATLTGTGNTATLNVLKAGSATLSCTCNGDNSVSWVEAITVTDSSPILPTGLTINGLPSTADMAKTKTIQLTAIVTPSNASDPTVTWSVSGPATITQDGLLTLTGTGDVTVTATSNAVKNVTATATLTVTDSTPANIPATSMTVSGLPDTVDIYKKKTYYVTVTVLPANATSKEWAFKADDMSMVQPVEGGVRFKKAGIVKLTFFMSRTPSVTWSKTITVTDSSPILPTGVTISGLPASIDFSKTKSVQLSATITPATATDRSVQWSATGPATITQDGLLTLTGTGTVTVSVACVAAPTVTGTATAKVISSVYGNEIEFTGRYGIDKHKGSKHYTLILNKPFNLTNNTRVTVTGSTTGTFYVAVLCSNTVMYGDDDSPAYSDHRGQTLTGKFVWTVDMDDLRPVNGAHVNMLIRSIDFIFDPFNFDSNPSGFHVYVKNTGGGQ